MTSHEFAAALRQVADFYEAHPTLPVPHEPRIHISAEDTKAEALRLAELLTPFRKEWSDSTLSLVRDFGGIELGVIFWRSTVCERRVVGVRQMPEQVRPAYTEEIVEWDCHPLLDAPERMPR